MAALTATGSDPRSRTRGAARREALLDVAARLVEAGPAEAVTMESVAGAAGVSRPLVYKHFANRHELLAALYERESALLHRELSLAVGSCERLEDMFRALVEGALNAQATRRATFAALAAQGGRPPGQRGVQRRRDSRTVKFFARRAVTELGIDEQAATTGVRIALGSISVVLDLWRRNRTDEHAARLADAYVTMAMGGLRSLR